MPANNARTILFFYAIIKLQNNRFDSWQLHLLVML
jgi:hypothetical protein